MLTIKVITHAAAFLISFFLSFRPLLLIYLPVVIHLCDAAKVVDVFNAAKNRESRNFCVIFLRIKLNFFFHVHDFIKVLNSHDPKGKF
jgi:hypothetical protein